MKEREVISMSINRKLFLGIAGVILGGGILFLSLNTSVKAQEDSKMGAMTQQHHGENWQEHCEKKMPNIDHNNI